MRRVLRSSVLALATISAVVLSGCSSGTQVDDIFSAGGWPGMHADARNSDTSPVTGSRELSFAWSRPLGGPVANYASVAASGQIFITARTEKGCNLFSYQMDSGRKRWCRQLAPGAVASTPIVDGAANVYVGENGAINSFNEYGQLRWRTPVSGRRCRRSSPATAISSSSPSSARSTSWTRRPVRRSWRRTISSRRRPSPRARTSTSCPTTRASAAASSAHPTARWRTCRPSTSSPASSTSRSSPQEHPRRNSSQ